MENETWRNEKRKNEKRKNEKPESDALGDPLAGRRPFWPKTLIKHAPNGILSPKWVPI